MSIAAAASLMVLSCNKTDEKDSKEDGTEQEVDKPGDEDPNDPDNPGGDAPDNPGGEDNPGDEDDPGYDPDKPVEPVVNPDGELECPNPPTVGTVEIDKLYGYATGVTGGEGATASNILHFNDGKALQTWLLARAKVDKGNGTPTIIWLSGTFKPGDGRDFDSSHPWFDVKEVSNISFLGTDDFVMDCIGFFIVRSKNIIIRNINMRMPKADNSADGISMQSSEGIWVDHCTFTSVNQAHDYEDGSTDITHATKNVTVSWCRYIKTQKSCLVGHSDGANADAAITATFHHNWFQGSSSRHPRVRYGTVHVYNNLYDGCTTYGAGSAYGAKVLLEYNYFDAVHLPTDICTYPAKQSGSSWVSNLNGKVAGYLYPTQNKYVNKPDNASDPYPFYNIKYKAYNGETITPLTYADFKPSYSYMVTAVDDVPAVVSSGAGHGKLGWKEAPVAVNNGNVTTTDPTDPDPQDPDVEDPDDPFIPDGAAHTYTVYMNDDKSPAVVQTVDGKTGGNYFSTSTASSDFSNDYKGAVTIAGKTYNHGFKLDSKGYVSFTASSEYTTTLQFYFVRRKSGDAAKIALIEGSTEKQVWDTPYDTCGDSGVITLTKGTSYTIKQKAKEQALVLAVITESE